MNESHDLTGDSPEAIQEILVAYLDGEVSTEVRVAIEQRLADDADYREQLVKLQQTWQLLDQLPTAQTDANFTRSTIAMVAVDVKRELTGSQTTATPSLNGNHQQPKELGSLTRELEIATSPSRSAWGYGLMAVIAALAVGFLAVFLPLQNQRRAALKDLPVVESLELYRYVDDVEFLKLLDDAKVFEVEDVDAP